MIEEEGEYMVAIVLINDINDIEYCRRFQINNSSSCRIVANGFVSKVKPMLGKLSFSFQSQLTTVVAPLIFHNNRCNLPCSALRRNSDGA